MGRSRRLLVALLAATALIAVGTTAAVALAAGSSPPSGESASPWKPFVGKARGLALADARKRLASFRPPPGSRRVQSLPKSLRLGGPALVSGSPNFLEVHALWVSSESAASVRAYLDSHTPPGSRHSLHSWAGDRGGTYRWDYGYGWPPLPEVAYERELLVGVVARPAGGSALRADSQTVWLEAKPKTERIPAGVGFLEVTETLAKKTHRAITASAAKIEAVTNLLATSRSSSSAGRSPAPRSPPNRPFSKPPSGPNPAARSLPKPNSSCRKPPARTSR